MTKKKIVSLSLVIALLATLVVGGTLAYFQDSDSQKNVMTLGGVDIVQLEKDKAGNDFEQDQPLLPMVDKREDKTQYPVVDGWFDIDMENVVDKVISVKNDATANPNAKNKDAYVRTLIAFEGRCDVQGVYIGKLWNKNDWTVNPVPKVVDGVEQATEVNGLVNAREVVINGEVHTVYEVIYKGGENGVLPAGEETAPSLKQIFMAPTAGNEIAELFGPEYTIYALTQATQVEGFADAEEALDTAFGDPMEVSDQVIFDWFKVVN